MPSICSFCGVSFEHVLRHTRVSERCLQLWVSRFNSMGVDEITYRPRCGRPRILAPETVSQTIMPVVDDPSLAGERHWTAVKLCGWLRRNLDLDLSYPTLVRYLHEQDYARRIPRPVPEPPDRDLRTAQREDFADELLGLLEAMANEFPAQRGKRIVPILDNASWHKSKSLCWHHIEAKFLPAYSPDFNPIERLWQHLKGNHLAGFLTKRGRNYQTCFSPPSGNCWRPPKQSARSAIRTRHRRTNF